MGITSAFLIQNVLKYLLNFGEVSDFLGYNALQNFFPTYTVKPNENCSNGHCRKAREAHLKYLAENPVVEKPKEEEKPVVHEDNEWGITLEEDSSQAPVKETATPQATYDLPEGLQFKFEEVTDKKIEDGDAVDTEGQTLEQLRAKLMGL